MEKYERKHRDPFWGGYKEVIRRYASPDGKDAHDLTQQEKAAVQAAVHGTESLQSGTDRIRLLDMVFWQRTHTIAGAAMAIHVSERTARRWHTDFIKAVAQNMRGECGDKLKGVNRDA